jgi:hypothetical protein
VTAVSALIIGMMSTLTQMIRLSNQTTPPVPLTIVVTVESARIEVWMSHHFDSAASLQGIENNQRILPIPVRQFRYSSNARKVSDGRAH